MISGDVQGLPTHRRLPGKAGQTCYSGMAEQWRLQGFRSEDSAVVASLVNQHRGGSCVGTARVAVLQCCI